MLTSRHILVIAPYYYTYRDVERGSGGSIFQYDQAHALWRAGFRIGVLAPYGQTVRMFYKEYNRLWRGGELTDDEGVSSCIYEGYHWCSERVRCLYLSHRFFCWVGMRLFQKYVSAYGLPDILHAHNTVPSGVLAHIISKKYRIPYVITEHNSEFALGNTFKTDYPPARQSWLSASSRIVVSPHLGYVVNRAFQTDCSFEYIPNMLAHLFREVDIQESNASDNKQFTFCNVASLIENKNHELLIRAFKQTFVDDEHVRLIIIGDGYLRKKLTDMIKSNNLHGKVFLKGPMKRQGVKEALMECDAFVLSSRYETFGVVLIEAMACGRPVIAPSGSGPDCIVTQDTGVLFPPDNLEQLSYQLLEMRNNFQKYDAYRIRQSCIDRFSEEVIVRRIVEVYERCTC